MRFASSGGVSLEASWSSHSGCGFMPMPWHPTPLGRTLVSKRAFSVVSGSPSLSFQVWSAVFVTPTTACLPSLKGHLHPHCFSQSREISPFLRDQRRFQRVMAIPAVPAPLAFDFGGGRRPHVSPTVVERRAGASVKPHRLHL